MQKTVENLKYIEIANSIVKNICDKKMAPGSYLPSESAFADKNNISRLTLRKALKHLEEQKIISPVIGKRRQVVKDFSKNNETLTVACLSYGDNNKSSFGNIVYMRLFEHLVQEFQKKNINIIKIIASPQDEDLPKINNLDKINAFIILGYMKPSILKKINAPTILWSNTYEPICKHLICPDGTATVIDAVQYLKNKGHKRLTFISNETSKPSPFVDGMRLGFERGVEFCDIKSASRTIELSKDEFYNNDLFLNKITEIMNSSLRPDAIIASSNNLALKMVSLFHKINIKVPDELSILAIGGTSDSELCYPGISGYENDYNKMASITCEYVINIALGRIKSVGKYYVTAFNLIERESVADRY